MEGNILQCLIEMPAGIRAEQLSAIFVPLTKLKPYPRSASLGFGVLAHRIIHCTKLWQASSVRACDWWKSRRTLIANNDELAKRGGGRDEVVIAATL